jgi:hypothetical protein
MDKLSYSLSDVDIKKFFQDKVNVIRFKDLKGKMLSTILGKYGRCIILIQQSNKNAHWVLLHIVEEKNKKPFIEWFDSYGLYPENKFNYIPKSFQKLSDQERGTIVKLLLNQPMKIHYSQYRLQELKNGMNTCGKHCCLRGYYNNISEDDYAKLIKSGLKHGISTDEMVNILYTELFNAKK